MSKPLNELEGRFDKESLIDKSLMASHEIGQSRIQEKIVNDFKKLLSVESMHVDRKGKTQVEVILDLKLILVQMRYLIFLLNMRKLWSVELILFHVSIMLKKRTLH